jgi:hypothetical protein
MTHYAAKLERIGWHALSQRPERLPFDGDPQELGLFLAT